MYKMKRFLSAQLSQLLFFLHFRALIPMHKRLRMKPNLLKTLDTHNDIDTKNFTEAVNYTQNLPKMRQGGTDVSWVIV